MTASPQPGNQDERCPVHPGCRHGGWDLGGSPPIVRESIEDALENDRCGICLSVDHFREDCPRAAAAAGETGAGEEADDVHEQAVAAFEADHREQQTVYAAHEWTSSDPDTCARCDVEWGDADATCAEPAPSAGQDTGRLRDEIARWLAARDSQDGIARSWHEDADALLDGPLRQLIAERDEAVAKVQRVEVAVDNARHMGWVSTEALCRALGSS